MKYTTLRFKNNYYVRYLIHNKMIEKVINRCG